MNELHLGLQYFIVALGTTENRGIYPIAITISSHEFTSDGVNEFAVRDIRYEILQISDW